MKLTHTFVLSALVCQSALLFRANAATWTAGSGTTNGWSDPANWDSPPAGSPVSFTATGVANVSGAVNNTIDAAYTILLLNYSALASVGTHTGFINADSSININNTGGTALFVGTGASLATADSLPFRLVGPGALTITNTTGIINISQGGGGSDHIPTLDLTGLTNFYASLSQIWVGCIDDTTTYGLRPMGIMRLAETNIIQTAAGTNQPGIMVACYQSNDTNVRGTQQLFLGGYNLFNCDTISMGGTKSVGQILFRPGLTGGSAILRGSAGGSDPVKILSVGDGRAGMTNYTPGATSSASSGTFDATGNSLDALVADLYVGRSQTAGNGATTGTLTFDTGTIVADRVFVGFQPSPASQAGNAFNATGTLNVNGNATLTVNNDLVLSSKAGTNIPVATLNISSNGTVNVKGNITVSNGVSTINFNGGTINMQPSGDATPGNVTVGSLNGVGTITNAANVTNTVALNPAGTTTAGTLSIAGNFVLANNAAMTFTITNTTTVGSGVNDLINVTGNLTLNNNLITFIPTAPTLASGAYRLFNYSGTRSGTLNFTNPTHYTASIDYSTNNQINALVSGSPASMRWNSTTSPLWDTTTSNWFNNGTAAIDRFAQLDNVVINDSGSYTNFLSLTTLLFPNTIQVIGTKDYNLGGPGRISGAASISKLGQSTLTISNANDFTGNVTINGGVLRVANSTALGTTNGGTTISGGSLDLSGTALFSPGEFFTIAGNGPTNGGAIINTGANQNNGVRFVSLTADSSIGTWPGRFDIRGNGGNGSFSGGLYLNGFTLTKLGAAQQSIVDTIATNAGSIVIAGGILGLTRSQIDGPGYINVLTNVLLFENSSTGYCAKPISVGGGTIRATGNAVGLSAPVTNVNGLTIDNAVTLTLSNSILGAGALTKISAGTLVLNAANTYSGPTAFTGGRVNLTATASLPNTPSIAVGAGTILDVSAVSGFALASGQTLSGSGLIVGDVNTTSANTIIPGSSPGTLTFSNNLTLNAITNIVELNSDPTQIGNGINDLIQVNGNLTLSGLIVIKIVPIGPLSAGTPYTIMTSIGTLNFAGATFQVISDNPRYSFSVVDPNTTPGSIQIQVAGNPTTLVWKGGQVSNPRAWDGSTANWLNNGSPDTFFSGDSVQFDDSSVTNNVSLIATEQPGAMTVTNNTLPYNIGGPGSISGGSLTKDLAASLAFTNSGSLGFSAGVALNNGAVTFANGGTNTLGGTVIVNNGPVTFSNNGPDNFTSGLTVNANVNVLNPFANNFGPNITLNAGSLAFNQPLDVAVGSVVGNTTPFVAGSIVKQGNNTLTLFGNNSTFDGPIVVSGGTLKAGNNNALGNANGDTTVASGATLDIAGFSLYNPGDIINIAGTGLSSTGAVINTGGAQQNAIRGLNLTADATIAAWSARWDVRGNGGNGSHSGQVALNGFTLTKLGSNTNSLVDCAVIGDGSIEILGGAMSITRTEVEPPGHVNVSSNLLVFENFSTTDPVLKPIIASGGTIRLTGNTFTLGSPLTNNLPGVTIDVASGLTLTAQGTISGGGSLSKITAGTLILTAPDSTWGVSTSIGAGTLQIGSGVADGSLPDLPISNNGTLIINSVNSFVISTNQIGGSGAITMLAGHLTLGGSNSYSGAVFVNSTTATDPNGAVLTISNSFALGANSANTRIAGNTTGNGRLELMGNINSPEPLLVDCRQSGVIHLPAILNVSGSNTLSGNVLGNTGGSDMNFQSDSGKLTMAGGFNCTSTAGTRRLKLMGAAYGEWSGIISNSVDGLVNTILIKTNAGTWTLSAANIYSGNTTIGGGTLALGPAGSINNSPTIDIQNGSVFDVSAVSGGYVLGVSQTLKGNGGINGNVIANGAVTPGESIGTLTFSNSVTLAGTTTMEINRDVSPNADLLAANALIYGGSLVVNNIGSNPQSGDIFNLFDWTTRSGSFGSISLPPLDPGLSWDSSQLTVDGTIRVSGGVNTTRTNLSIFVTGSSLDISWPADHTGWRLESQTNNTHIGLNNNWFTVPNSSTTNHMVMPIDPANGSVFFRMAYP